MLFTVYQPFCPDLKCVKGRVGLQDVSGFRSNKGRQANVAGYTLPWWPSRYIIRSQATTDHVVVFNAI